MELSAILSVKQLEFTSKSELLEEYSRKSFAFQFDRVSKRLLK